jgi:hypothetical protein
MDLTTLGILSYLALYLTVVIVGTRSDLRDRSRPPAVAALVVLAYAALGAGVLVFSFPERPAEVTAIWPVVFPFALAGVIADVVLDLRTVLRNPPADLDPEDRSTFAVVGTVFAILFELPAVWMNVLLLIG